VPGLRYTPPKSTLALYCDDKECKRQRSRQRQRRHRQYRRALTIAPVPLAPRPSHRVRRIPGILNWRADNLALTSGTKSGPVIVSFDKRPEKMRLLIARTRAAQARRRPKRWRRRSRLLADQLRRRDKYLNIRCSC
jgi:hypothetical protein